MMRLAVFCLCLLGVARPAAAQTLTDGRVWFSAIFQGPVGKASPWRWTFDAVLRSRDGVEALDTRTFRPYLTYAVSKHSSVGGGYAHIKSFAPGGGFRIEYRVFGLYLWNHPAGGGTAAVRLRLEDRFIERSSGMLWRFRPQLRFSRPVQPGSRFAFVASDELSLHLNSTSVSRRGVDQNRAFGGVSTTWSPHLRLETGYLNQFLPGHGLPNRMNHVASVTVVASF